MFSGKWQRPDVQILKMKISLVFTPFQKPSSPPLGIAYLKSCIEEDMPSARVKTIDLNVRFFHKILSGRADGFCRNCRIISSSCVPSELFVRNNDLSSVLRRNISSQRNPHSYLEAVAEFDMVFHRVQYCWEKFLRYFLDHDFFDSQFLDVLRQDAELLLSGRPQIIGFSVFSEGNLLYALALAKLIKSKSSSPVVFGGAMMSHLDCRQMLEACNFIDYIFIGEAERALAGFLRHLPEKKFSLVPNLVYRQGRKIVVNEKKLPADLDTLPFPDFSDFDLQEYLVPRSVLPILSSRGCYWGKCTFCTHTVPYSGLLRNRSASNVVDELEWHMKKQGVRHFLFADEAISPVRLTKISKEIQRRNIGIFYGTEGIRPEKGFTRAVLKDAHGSGLRYMYIGVESVTQRLLDKMCKGTTVQVILQMIRDCLAVGIRPFLSYIVGFPSQTRAELEKECAFLNKHSQYSGASLFGLLKGSQVFNNLDAYDIEMQAPLKLASIKNVPIHSCSFDYAVRGGLSAQEISSILRGKNISTGSVFDEINDLLIGSGEYEISGKNSKPRVPLEQCPVRKPGRSSDYDHFLSGHRHKLCGRYAQALAHFLIAKKLSPSGKFHSRICFYAGICCSKLKNHVRASVYLKTSVKSFPRNSIIYNRLGKAYFYARKYKLAIPALKTAIRLNPQNQEAKTFLIKTYLVADGGRSSGKELSVFIKELERNEKCQVL
jgi:anaerobic magnesium-protoporphyrin IX monomethyl ester cyclase